MDSETPTTGVDRLVEVVTDGLKESVCKPVSEMANDAGKRVVRETCSDVSRGVSEMIHDTLAWFLGEDEDMYDI